MPVVDDRWLWLGLGTCLFGAIKGVSHFLFEIDRLNEVQEQPRKPLCPVSHHTEKAIKLESLKTLALSSNIDMRNAAIRILCNRLHASGVAKDMIYKDLQSNDPERHVKAGKALRLIQRHSLFFSEFIFQGQPREPPTAIPSRSRPRRHEESPEEQALRRRRREAMVFHEGDRPISQDDIIQRGGRPRDDETRRTERALASLSNGPSGREEAQQGS